MQTSRVVYDDFHNDANKEAENNCSDTTHSRPPIEVVPHDFVLQVEEHLASDEIEQHCLPSTSGYHRGAEATTQVMQRANDRHECKAHSPRVEVVRQIPVHLHRARSCEGCHDKVRRARRIKMSDTVSSTTKCARNVYFDTSRACACAFLVQRSLSSLTWGWFCRCGTSTSKSNAIKALVKPVVMAEITMLTSANDPASSGLFSHTYSCSTHPGMLSVPSCVEQ